MKKVLLLIAFSLLLLSCRRSGVAPDNRMLKETKLLMGTTVEITVRGEDKTLAGKAIEQAFREMEKVDDLMSTFKEDSEISLLNREGARKPVKVSRETFRVIRESIRLSEVSNGAFDITVKPLVDLWRSVRKKERLLEELKKTLSPAGIKDMKAFSSLLPGKEELKKVLALVNYRNILLNEKKGTVRFREAGMEIDLGGIAKGYAVDKAVEKLRQEGVKQAIVNAGGDLYLLGSPPGKSFWNVGINHPFKKGKILGMVRTRNEAIATSGNYERYFTLGGKRYGHILNPHTGMPVEGILSVTVLSEKALTADGLATAIFVLGPKKGLELANRIKGVEAIIVSKDKQGGMIVSVSEGLKSRLSLDKQVEEYSLIGPRPVVNEEPDAVRNGQKE